ncbi:cache domain-containing protein [Leifsonia sp. McL0607]|uniref:cache domain-containing protein n=1 Tax=Leifsonia sp. McL0607 TaxID=3415672 RepID=UPI003CF6EF20
MAETVVTTPGADTTCVDAAAERVSALFGRLHERLAGWRDAILADQGADGMPAAALDDRVERLVVPALGEDDPVLVGAGFVAAPEFTGGDDLHFAWWLGRLEENPLTGATTEPSRLDLASRSYSDYLRDFRSLEWYSIPRSTHRTHITGPYVDHLCACDYIVTVTSPVEGDGRMLGVVGVDVYVRRLERELLPAMLAIGRPVILVNEWGRVMVSTDPSVLVGSLAEAGTGAREDSVRCVGTPFRLVATEQAS